jgi:hypothetical protein
VPEFDEFLGEWIVKRARLERKRAELQFERHVGSREIPRPAGENAGLRNDARE